MIDFNITSVELGSTGGLDDFLGDNPTLVDPLAIPKQATTAHRVIKTLDDLKGFTRVASDTLIHQSTQDFWALKQGDNGDYVIERLIDGTNPVAG